MARGIRLFSHAQAQPRARRATDVILLALSLFGLLVVAIAAEPEPGYSTALTALLVSLPSGLDGTWQIFSDAPMVWSATILIIALVRNRRSIARDMIVAVVFAILLWLLLGRTVTGEWPSVVDGLDMSDPDRGFPAARLAIPGAAIIAASPHLVRPARRLGRWLLVFGSFATITLEISPIFGVLAGMLCASAAAAIVHLLVGSSAGRPSLDDVRYALADLGVAIDSLGVADRQDAGQFTVAASGADGSDLIVKVYGRDAYDAALLSSVRRTVWLRRPGSPVGFGRLRQVEHEAFLTLLASQGGIHTDTVITAGATKSDDALLVVRRTGERLVVPNRVVTAADATDERFAGADGMDRIRELWQLVARLHATGIAHGQLDEDHFMVQRVAAGPESPGSELGLIDFRGATVSPTDAQLRSDDVQAFITTVVLAGRDQAVAGLVANQSNDEIEACLPYLQSPALTADQRRMMRSLDLDLDDLRSEVAAAIGLEAPKLVQLRRFSVGSMIRIALPLLAVFMLVSALAGFDLAEFAESLQDASWWLVALGFVIAQSPRIAQAVATMGAAPIPLPLGPVYALQLAISYVNLAIPTAAARIAVNIRFFQRQGVPPGAAVATGALDGVSGFIVQATLLVGLLVFTPMSLELDLGDPTSDAKTLVLWIAARGRRGRDHRRRHPEAAPLHGRLDPSDRPRGVHGVARPALAASPADVVRRQPGRRTDLRRHPRDLHPRVR